VPTKVRQAIRIVEDDGWYQVSAAGSHRQFKLAPGTMNSILKQAGLKK
jgi:predicted RNA binding protein YcfA (HicA-like mRNA interferase family)